MIIFRTDANDKIATGHLMRCLAIAGECLAMRPDIPVSFVFADTESASLLKKLCPIWQDYQSVVLDTPYDDPDIELPVFLPLVIRHEPRGILIDSYHVSPQYLAAVGNHARTFYLEDMKTFATPVDVVINYGVTPDRYRGTAAGRCLIGPEYAPVRREFRGVPYVAGEAVRNIIITVGGADMRGMAAVAVTAVRMALGADVACHVTVGVMSRHYQRLREMAAQDDGVVLYEDYNEMAALMRHCDMAISAAGSTMYELAAIGVPTVCFAVADNQVPNTEFFTINGAAFCANADPAITLTAEQLAIHVKSLAADWPRRHAISLRMREMVDGFGAARIAAELCAAKDSPDLAAMESR